MTTNRETKLVKGILDVLHQKEGGQMADTILHADLNLLLGEQVPLLEFNSALSIADRAGLITSIHARFGSGMRRNINDAGEAARLEMQ